ncbi:MAG: hypothetical protein Kow00128_00450 [Deltaproteobacteria bacterium]
MDLSISQLQNVLRTYQKQVREEKVREVLGIREEASRWKDRVDISKEGRDRLENQGAPAPGANETSGS